jgi:uncharacterized membrane protein YgaE (UPF0421/DUF939 family)
MIHINSRLHSLQKKLIAKAKEEREKQEAIEIKEKLYLHLKSMLAKQVGPEATEQANDFVKALKEKRSQLRHMDTELNMYQAQVREYKHSIDTLDGGLADIKKKFLLLYMKRAEQAANAATAAPDGYEIEAKDLDIKDHPLLPIAESGEGLQSANGSETHFEETQYIVQPL